MTDRSYLKILDCSGASGWPSATISQGQRPEPFPEGAYCTKIMDNTWQLLIPDGWDRQGREAEVREISLAGRRVDFRRFYQDSISSLLKTCPLLSSLNQSSHPERDFLRGRAMQPWLLLNVKLRFHLYISESGRTPLYLWLSLWCLCDWSCLEKWGGFAQMDKYSC